jgi:Domain of unknown function (DUF4338)
VGQKVKKKSVVISAFTPEARLKRKIRAHLRKLGFVHAPDGSLAPQSSSKESIRALHLEQRRDRLKSHKIFVQDLLPKLETYFANGSEIEPGKIQPRLELIEADTWQSDLFRLATLSWSVPVSYGFGRRLRYLVWDDHNNKLIGIIALGDPVYNLRVRDELIGWTATDRSKRLVGVLDAYVLGSVPPYNMILGGKLVACLVRTKEVRNDFAFKYGNTRGIISKKKKRAELVLVTTSSSLGRSSVYNRLKLGSQTYLKAIGYTEGWGHFHVPDSLFAELRDYLRKRKHGYEDGHKFGEGPNWRLRTIRVAFEALGVNADWLRHGIGREVYMSEVATNSGKVLRGESTRAVYRGLKTVSEVGELARQRWLVPRATTRTEYKDWKRDQFKDLVLGRKKSLSEASTQASPELIQKPEKTTGR